MPLLQKLKDIFLPSIADESVGQLYNICVAQARTPVFYEKYGVPDTVDGRFDMLLLHIVMLMRRLDGHHAVRQQLFDLMFADMDRSLREMGVGDMSISKKMRPMIQAFYGRAQAYNKALENQAMLAQTLQRNIYGTSPVTEEQVHQMTDYVCRLVVSLEQHDLNNIVAGHLSFGSAA